MNRLLTSIALGASLVGIMGVGTSFAAGIEKLPITCFVRINGPDSKAVYASCDRRFIFRGEMIDLWTGAAPSYERSQQFDLSRNDFRPDEFSFPFLVPDKPKATAYVYVTLDSKASVDYLRALRSVRPKDTEVRVVLVSSLSTASRRMNEAVWCAADRVKAIVSVLEGAGSADREESECDLSGLMLAQASTYLFGISRLPLTVMANGKSFYGIPSQMSETFEEMIK